MKKMLLLIALVIAAKANATHIASAELYYHSAGFGLLDQYRVYLVLIKACEPGSVNLNATENIKISGQTSTFTHTLPFIMGPDVLGTYCPGNLNSCLQSASLLPGFERRVYSSIVTLPGPGNYTISWRSCCRPNGILNLNSPGSEETYVEATLVNVAPPAVANSNAWLPDPNPLWITQGVTNTFPLQAYDMNHDSLAYELYQPLTVLGAPIPYASGYSLSSPLGAGGILTINPNNTLTILAPTSGKFAMGIKIKEYKNGQLVGSSMRDLTVVAMPSGPSLTTPLPSPNTSLIYTTCPGATNTITLNFIDPDPADSVFLTITPPTLPGFTFNTVVNPGPGSATATISWTTPATMNPATLPSFHLNVLAKDNACPAHASANYVVAVYTAMCLTDSVWAGDANGDYTVNHLDPLAVAVAYGKTGTARANATTNWVAEYCAPWTDTFINGVNLKHADCNGDGTVNSADLPAVGGNWGLVHLKTGPKARTTGLPELYFDISGISFTPGSTVSIPIMMGTTASPISNFYGVGANVSIAGHSLAAPATISYPVSWLGTSANTLNYVKTINNASLGWSYARIDQQAQNGQGEIARLDFTIPANTSSGLLTLSFNGAKVIDNMMNDIAIAPIDTSVMIWALSVDDMHSNLSKAAIIPNPSAENASLQLQLAKETEINITILDPVGKLVYSNSATCPRGENKLELPANLAPGLYLVRTMDGDKELRVLKWFKN